MKKVVAAVMLLLLPCGAVSYAEVIKVEGGGTTISTVFLPIKEGFEKYHGHTLSIVQSTAIKGLIAVNDGKVDIAAAAHPLEDLIAGAAKNGVVIDKSRLVATQIDENRLIVITNKSNPVTGLSKEQLKGVFTGKISNWKEVGGTDLPVKVVWGRETQGQNIQFTRMALDGEAVTSKATPATGYRNISEVVKGLPGAIGVVPMQINTPATRSLETMTIASPVYAITRGEPSAKVKEVLDYYKNDYTLN